MLDRSCGRQKRSRRRAEEWKDDAAAASVQLLYAQDWLYTTEYTGIILSDLAFTLGSVCCVYVLLWLYTASAPLALLGLIQILLAFPVTLFVYAVVLRIKLFECCRRWLSSSSWASERTTSSS